MKHLLTTAAIVAMLGLGGCINPHGMQAVGGPDDAGYTYHTAQACVDFVCGTGIASAALYGPPRPDGSRDVVPLGSTSIVSAGTLTGLVAGAVAAGAVDGLTHNPALIKQ
jgi:hypothetical protein